MSNTATLIAAVTKARATLSDPERVVLDPLHYVEISRDGVICGGWRGDMWAFAEQRRRDCRVCMMGACGLAAVELAAQAGKTHADLESEADDLESEVEALLTGKIKELGIEPSDEVADRWCDERSVLMTSALIQGRAVEVCDAVLADLRQEV